MKLRTAVCLLPAALLLLGAAAFVPGARILGFGSGTTSRAGAPEEGILERLAEVDLDKAAKKIAKGIRAQPRPRIDAPRSPELLQSIQKVQGPVFNRVMDVLAVPADDTLDYVTVRDLTLRAAGVSGARPPKLPVESDLRSLETFLEDVFQQIRRDIGTGQELDIVVSKAQGAIDRMRLATESDRLVGTELEQVVEQFERLQKADPGALLRQTLQLAEVALSFRKEERVQVLRRLEPRNSRDADVTGTVLEDRDTPFGRFVIGGFGDNTYDCTQIDVIFDPGGNDTYNGPAGATMPLRRLGVVIDVEGNDTYAGGNDSLGAAIYGIGLVADLAGDDSYTAEGRSGGFGMGGVGMVLDAAGKDTVRLGYLGGGCGLGGVGLFVDLGGDDLQVLGSQGFGLGMPTGLGVFADLAGNDERQVKSVEVSDSRGTGTLAMALGAGSGLTGVLRPGVGIYLDGAGEDNIQAEMLSLGSGVQGGLGIAMDLGTGNDIYRVGAGSLGAAHSHGIGIFLDAGGNDDYTATGGLAVGGAAHQAEAWFVDFAGDDRYRAVGPSFGWCVGAGLAGCFDLAGTDRYRRDEVLKLPWPARGPEPEGASVSVTWDDGGMRDDYRWAGDASPVDGRVIQGDESVKGGRAKTARVDR